MDRRPQFDIGSAFDFIKEKEGREPPAFYKMLHDQNKFKKEDMLSISVSQMSYLQNGVSPYMEQTLKGWNVTIKDAIEVPHFISIPFVRKLTIEAPRLKHLGDIHLRYGYFPKIDLSSCVELENINNIRDSYVELILNKECPLALKYKSTYAARHFEYDARDFNERTFRKGELMSRPLRIFDGELIFQ